RFVYVSTDEVFGSLLPDEPPFDEHSSIRPNNPYAASKAAAEQFVRAWHKTYGLPTIIANACNNYGEYQHNEKLIPTVINHALHALPIPMYGDGKHIRDWIYVGDTARALWKIFQHSKAGERWIIGANYQLNNQTLIRTITALLDKHYPTTHNPHCSGSLNHYAQLIKSVTDRLGHDRRYAVNPAKLQQTLNWQAQTPFTQGIEQTVLFYIQQFQVKTFAKSFSKTKS
ncbi:MAG: GDP-mannose 4,6-dehydratase, partial [Neisseriaceae bacterium]|nr:GDP-mannose 4,6-dehydratase [Neisseriaceae bacterium]